MPEGIGYNTVSSKNEPARAQQNVSGAKEPRTRQVSNERPSEPVNRRDNPAVEVRISNEARKAEDAPQPRQDANTYAALQKKS